MIISRTPLRMSFVGGGSDMESYYSNTPGAVVSTAINKYIYIMVSKQFDGRIIIQYSDIEIVTNVSDIKNNLIREALKMTGIKGGIHITSISDVPAEGTGMGSSSSYIVGLLHALYAYQGKYINAEKLAKKACKIEIDILKKPIGKQDQYIAAYGGLQFITFNTNKTIFIDPIISGIKTRLEKNLLLFYTGITRSADAILVKQKKNMNSQKKRTLMTEMVELAKAMRKALNKNNLDSFGEMLHQNWLLKRQITKGVTNKQIDNWYETALKNGAIGGKLLGAGGGGFLLFYAQKKKHKKIIAALPDLIYQDFSFESQGSKIIFVD